MRLPPVAHPARRAAADAEQAGENAGDDSGDDDRRRQPPQFRQRHAECYHREPPWSGSYPVSVMQ